MGDSDMSDLNLSDDDGFTGQEKMLLEKHRSRIGKKSQKVEEEVFGFESSGDEAAAKDSDLDGASDEDLPNLQAWGKQKKSFYNTDYVDQDFGGFQEKEEEAAKLEEEEALRIQKKLAEELDEEDFNLVFQDEQKSSEKSTEFEVKKEIKKDLSQMTDRQKLQIFHQENPEFASLVEEFKGNIEILKNTIEPLRQMLQTINLSSVKDGEDLKESLETYHHVLLNYNINLSFYLLLKTRRASVKNHPVARRLLQYRILLRKIHKKWILPKKNNLIQQILAVSEEQIKKESTLQAISNQHKLFVQKLLQSSDIGDDSSEESDDENNIEEEPMEKDADSGDGEGEIDEDAKRGITYQIAKNKGLTPYRKKELRNPRVKHRMKFRKAVIRRKGQVREYRPELQKYGGEFSGIKASVTKSVKLK